MLNPRNRLQSYNLLSQYSQEGYLGGDIPRTQVFGSWSEPPPPSITTAHARNTGQQPGLGRQDSLLLKFDYELNQLAGLDHRDAQEVFYFVPALPDGSVVSLSWEEKRHALLIFQSLGTVNQSAVLPGRWKVRGYGVCSNHVSRWLTITVFFSSCNRPAVCFV